MEGPHGDDGMVEDGEDEEGGREAEVRHDGMAASWRPPFPVAEGADATAPRGDHPFLRHPRFRLRHPLSAAVHPQ